jgi:DNA invertase Pin-like site-specific DNA recombinase
MMIKRQAIAYYRTSSAANVGPDKDSQRRQKEAVEGYAKEHKIEIKDSVYDAAVSGADPHSHPRSLSGVSSALSEDAEAALS